MKRVIILLSLALFSTNVQAVKYKDNSLSPAESLSLPDVSREESPYSKMQPPNFRSNETYGYRNKRKLFSDEPSKALMEDYCKLAALPMGQDSGACTARSRKDACTRWERMPEDAKFAIDESLACQYTMNNINADDTICSGADTHVLEVAKKYWRDQTTLYALLFLPELVLPCVRGME